MPATMSITRFFRLLVGLWLVAGVAGEGSGGDEFANNLFSDLAPYVTRFILLSGVIC